MLLTPPSAVGSIAVQLAKNVIGAKRVVGIAGGPEKCDWVVKHLGADACVDYKAGGDLRAQIKEALGGEFATKYFENVGGNILNTMFTLVARHGKIAVCGMISGYMGNKPDLSNFGQIISNRVQIEGESEKASGGSNASTIMARWGGRHRSQQRARWLSQSSSLFMPSSNNDTS